jgi:hypothetical protein
MLRFQWNALRINDHVLVHDDLGPGLELNEGVVALVETRPGHTNYIGVRSNTTGRMLRPRRRAVHLLPLDRRISCWRCDLVAAQETVPDRHASAA